MTTAMTLTGNKPRDGSLCAISTRFNLNSLHYAWYEEFAR
jgi:hypothetical protein